MYRGWLTGGETLLIGKGATSKTNGPQPLAGQWGREEEETGIVRADHLRA
jgi:hypothetical protein